MKKINNISSNNNKDGDDAKDNNDVDDDGNGGDEEDVEERLQKLERDVRFVETSGEDEFPDWTLTIKYHLR